MSFIDGSKQLYRAPFSKFSNLFSLTLSIVAVNIIFLLL